MPEPTEDLFTERIMFGSNLVVAAARAETRIYYLKGSYQIGFGTQLFIDGQECRVTESIVNPQYTRVVVEGIWPK